MRSDISIFYCHFCLVDAILFIIYKAIIPDVMDQKSQLVMKHVLPVTFELLEDRKIEIREAIQR